MIKFKVFVEGTFRPTGKQVASWAGAVISVAAMVTSLWGQSVDVPEALPQQTVIIDGSNNAVSFIKN